MIDEHGRLLGRVNVIDLLAVLLATAALVAGLAIALDGRTRSLASIGVVAFALLAITALARAPEPSATTVATDGGNESCSECGRRLDSGGDRR